MLLLFAGISCFLFLLIPENVYGQTAPADIVIINQIRGKEACCHPGSSEFLEKLSNDSTASKLSLSFAFRYDALSDREFTRFIPSLPETGLLLEITPDLAAKSGIQYRGNPDGSDWYQAEYSLLVGYTQDERKRLIDTAVSAYRSAVGKNPPFTVSWMIDAWSLSYLRETYGIFLHELTKEQYETDSYTVYGGIFNAPYYPSQHHPLIPAKGKSHSGVVIIRQTVSDLVRNYGSPVSSYTSQPNDYLESRDGLSFSYFQQLIEGVLKQHDLKFAVLGLENSFTEEKYFKEFMHQLSYISDLEKGGKLRVQRASDFAETFTKKQQENKPFLLIAEKASTSAGVLWYFSPNYRARLLHTDTGLMLTDFRVYGDFPDPYETIPAPADYSYWVIPPLIDGSQQYTPKTDTPSELKYLLDGSTTPDTVTSSFGIRLCNGEFTVDYKNDALDILCTGEPKGSIVLSSDSIKIDRAINPCFSYKRDCVAVPVKPHAPGLRFSFPRHFDFVVEPDRPKTFSIGFAIGEKLVILADLLEDDSFLTIKPRRQVPNLALLDPMLQADRSNLPIDAEKTIAFWSNKRAVAGRNPALLYVLPKNELDRPAVIQEVSMSATPIGGATLSYPQDIALRVRPWFVTVTANDPLTTYITMDIDGKRVVSEEKITFAVDCRLKLLSCVFNPRNLYDYITARIEETIKRPL